MQQFIVWLPGSCGFIDLSLNNKAYRATMDINEATVWPSPKSAIHSVKKCKLNPSKVTVLEVVQ